MGDTKGQRGNIRERGRLIVALVGCPRHVDTEAGVEERARDHSAYMVDRSRLERRNQRSVSSEPQQRYIVTADTFKESEAQIDQNNKPFRTSLSTYNPAAQHSRWPSAP